MINRGVNYFGKRLRFTWRYLLIIPGLILLGIISVPGEAAQDAADRLIEAGVLGLLNFAPVRLEVGDRASVASVDFSSRLERLAFEVSAGLKGPVDSED